MIRFAVVIALVFAAFLTPVAAKDRTVMRFDPSESVNARDLFPRSGKGFTNKKTTASGNDIGIIVDPQLNQRVIKLSAMRRRGNNVSKSSLVHEGFSATEGSTLTLSMDIKLIGHSLGGSFIADIECSDCWPKWSLLPNKSPGIRLYIDKSSQSLAIDRGKIGLRGKPLRSKRAPRFPKGKWVNLVLKMEISRRDSALTQVFVDGKQYLAARGATLMDQRTFSKYGVNLRKIRYNYVELGITANESANELQMHISDVEIRLD